MKTDKYLLLKAKVSNEDEYEYEHGYEYGYKEDYVAKFIIVKITPHLIDKLQELKKSFATLRELHKNYVNMCVVDEISVSCEKIELIVDYNDSCQKEFLNEDKSWKIISLSEEQYLKKVFKSVDDEKIILNRYNNVVFSVETFAEYGYAINETYPIKINDLINNLM